MMPEELAIKWVRLRREMGAPCATCKRRNHWSRCFPVRRRFESLDCQAGMIITALMLAQAWKKLDGKGEAEIKS